MAITTIKIFPTIGIARIGNSTEFFVGSEIPGVRTPPPGGYKDAHCRVKRQAARFRLYAFDENGNLIIENGKPKEITAADGPITWTVELANKKASWKRFEGLNANASVRNAGVANRASLEITPGPRSLNGPNQAAAFNTGSFLGKPVPLGEMRTEADGRLLVIGGFGNSGSVPPGEAIVTYANNENWHDDISDGPVKATVTISINGVPTTFQALPSWVICPPPDFAPPVDSVTSLYDVILQWAVDHGQIAATAKPSFTADIFPILNRVLSIGRVNQQAAGHSSFPGAFPPASQSARQAIFNRLRNPNNPNGPATANMPKIYDDSEQTFQTVTKLQYSAMQKWAGIEGTDWTNDWTGSPPAPPTDVTPDGLTRAALEACVGGAFFPGIEASWFLRDTYNYTELFRLDQSGLSAGDVTKQMAVPWQADFFKCNAYSNGTEVFAWWPAQRPDDVFPESGGGPAKWVRNIVTSHQDMVDYWSKLGFIVAKNGQLIETERHVVCTNIFLITDRSHFSEDEVAGALTGGPPGVFPDSLYVVAEGFLPAEFGVTTASPTPAQLLAMAPMITITRGNNVAVPGMSAKPQALLLEDNSLPATVRQRFTFVYQVEFLNTDGFNDDNNQPIESQAVTVTATKNALSQTFTSVGTLTLFHQPNPYMLDGPVSWLSTDVRVFQIKANDSRFGVTLGPLAADTPAAGQASALQFVSDVVGTFRTAGPVNHPFDTISTDANTSQLELSEKVGSTRIFNFAIARVRYRGNVLSANNVKVFFRLFTTAATGLDYDSNSAYRRTQSTTDPISLLGLQAGYLVTIPCYGRVRVDTAAASLSTQTDDLNKQDLQPAGASEFHGYYGCWLDINQTTPQFPSQPNPVDGQWPMGRLPIQQLIRGLHQCIVAEVYFPNDPIPQGASPASNDNLAQRNLVIVESGNPSMRRITHTFEIKATRPRPRIVAAVVAGNAPSRIVEAGPDELMFRWNNLPRETEATLYIPDLNADEVLQLAGRSYEAERLQRVDAHTIRCLLGDVTYVPIPPGNTRNIAALMTLDLPDHIKRDQTFRVSVHQISGRPRALLGAFQLTIPVQSKAILVEPEKRRLSVLRYIAGSIPADDRWRPVFDRYVDQVADRVRGFGADPDQIAPAADGSGHDRMAEECARRGWFVSALLALLVVVAALHPLPGYLAEVVVAAAAALSVVTWARRCAPSVCRLLVAAILGISLGAALVAVLFLLAVTAPHGPIVLVVTAIALGLLALAWASKRCAVGR